MSDELTTITFRLPLSLREKIQERAAAEERSESAFIRFYIGKLLSMTEAECELANEEPQPERRTA